MKPRILSSVRLSFPLASALAALFTAQSAYAASQTWGANGNSAWYTGSNWAGGAAPGLQGNAASNTDVATFTSAYTGTAVGINMNAAGAYLNLGAISLDATRTTALSIGNTSTTVISGNGQVLRLYGATVNSVANTIISNAGSGLLTIQNTGPSGTQFMGVALGNTTNNINITGAGGVTISSLISQINANSSLTVQGGGSGALTLNGSAVNTFTGGVNINSSNMVLDFTNLSNPTATTPTNLVNSGNALQINNGTLTITGKNLAGTATAQTFAGTTLGAGINTVNIAKGALSTSATLTLGALTLNSAALTTFSPTTAWTTTASTTERVFISAGGSVNGSALVLPSGANTAFVNAGMFHRAAGGAAGTLRLAAVNSAGQLLLKANAGNLAIGTGVDPTGSYQLAAGSIALTNTAASVYGLLLNATSAGTNITVADSGTLTLNSVIQIKATENVTIAPGTGGRVVIGAEKNLVIAMDNTAAFGISAPIDNFGSTAGVGGTASALTIIGNTTITPGTVTLSGVNTYTGPTTITRGTLALGNANALATTSGLTLGGASAATLTNSGDVNNIVINGPITAANSGVTSTISYSRTTSAQGSITLDGGITGGAGNVTFTTPNVNSAGNLQTFVLGGGVGSAGGYGGNTTLTTGNAGNAMQLRSGIANALPTTTVLTFAQNAGSGSGRATIFNLAGFNQTLAGLSNTGNVPDSRNMLVTSTAAATLTINNTADFTFGGRSIIGGVNTIAQIQGAISLVKSGAGTFTLGGTLVGGAVAGGNTFTGSTQILGGILVLGESNSIQSSAFDTTSVLGNLTNGLRAGTGVTALTLGGLTGGNNLATRFTTTTGGYTNLTALTLNPESGVTNTYSGDIGNGNGSMSLTKTNLGTQVLSTTNSYTGTTTIGRGTLQINSIADYNAASSIGSPASGDLVIGSANTGVLDYVGSGNSSNRTITVGSSTATNGGGAFVLANGGAALTFTATTFNTAQGAATVARTLTLGGAGIGAIDGTIQNNNTGGGGNVAVTKQDAGTWTLSGGNTYTGLTNVIGGALNIASAGSLNSGNALTVGASGTADFANAGQTLGAVSNSNTTVSALNFSANTGTVILASLSGAGNTRFASNGTVTGAFATGTVTAVGIGTIGTMSSGTANLNGATSAITTLNGGTVNLGTTVLSVSNGTNSGAITGANGALTKISSGTLTLSGPNTYDGVTNVDVGTLVIGSTNALGSTTGNTVIASGAQVSMFTANLAVAEAFNIAGSGVGGTGGAIQFGGGVSGMSIDGAVTLSGAATLKTDGGAGSAFSGGIDNAGNALTFTVDGGATSTVSTNGITGAGDLIKTSTGTLNLNVSSDYSGATTVSAGRLTISSAGTINSTSGVLIGAGDFNYNSATALSQGVSFSGTGGKLSGSGTITPSVTITAGNTLAPGNSIGTLTFGTDLTLAGTYSVELGTVDANPALSLSDRTVVTGTLAIGGNLTLVNNANANGNGSAAPGAYRIATSTGATSGTFATITNPLSATLHEGVVYGTNTTDLNIYRLATGSTANTDLGKARVGDALSGNLTTTNSATADGFSENLNASVGSNAGDVNASSGSVSGVIAGANASTINVGLSTATSGAKSGTVLVSSVSDGTGLNNYTTTANGSQTVTVTGSVYDLATANFAQTAGAAISGSGPAYTLDFGSGLSLDTLYTASFSIQNGVVVNSFIDTLSGGYGLTGAGEFATSAIDFSALAAGAAANLFNITFQTSSEGSYSGTFTFDGTSVQSGLSPLSVGDFTIALSANAIPEPNVAALLGGLGVLALLRRRRN